MDLCGNLVALTGQVLFCGQQEPINSLEFQWSLPFVFLSLMICIVYSGIACDMYAKTCGPHQTYHQPILKIGTIYGVGIFSMHFVGMYALISPGPMQYDLFITVFSLLTAISGTSITVLLIHNHYRLIWSAILFGLTICSMHYAGMLSIIANPYHMHHKLEWLLVAVVYAVLGSYLALFFFVKYTTKHNKTNLIVSSLLMGLTISGVHYLAMAAMELSPADMPLISAYGIYIGREIIIVFTLLMLLLTIMAYISDSINSERYLVLKKQELEFSNKSINSTLNKLKAMQAQLIESEKMASLGQLVTGVAHEVNTPLGICITSASFLDDTSKRFFQRFETNTLARTDFDSYMNDYNKSMELILNQLNTASDLIRSFKQVAVDQTNEITRTFEISHYIKEVIASLNHNINNTQHKVVFNCDESFEVTTYAGALSIVISQLVSNSLVHAFEENKEGVITINLKLNDTNVELEYSDNGRGVAKEELDNLFSPFYTTKRAQGCLGLGMHIVYNQITQKLNGKLVCTDNQNPGFNITVIFPQYLSSEAESKGL